MQGRRSGYRERFETSPDICSADCCFCKQRGIRQNHFVEQAILEKLEDEMDMEIINQREFEDLIAWKDAG